MNWKMPIIGDEMYYRLLNHFEQALEMKHY